MANRRRHPITAGARFILAFLSESTEAKSYLDIADGAKLSYFHTRKLCAELVGKRMLLRTSDGKRPVFSLNRDYRQPLEIVLDTGLVPTPRLPGQRRWLVNFDESGKPTLTLQGVL
jgi:hypothetical protein